jgi:hypothetical protein
MSSSASPFKAGKALLYVSNAAAGETLNANIFNDQTISN